MRQPFVGVCLGLVITACSTANPPAEIEPLKPEAERVRAIVYRPDGKLAALVETEQGCELKEVASAPGSSAQPVTTFPSPIDCRVARILSVGPAVVVSDARSAVWIEGSHKRTSAAVLTAVAADNLVQYLDGRLVWMTAAKSTPLSASLSSPQLLGDGSAVIAIERNASGARLVSVSRAAEMVGLTPFFQEIDSFAVDPKGKEVAFSARRDTFDIGLVSTSGSDVSWVGPDASDEVEVTWAPRGNKITYVVKQFGGTTFRTVHIPTGYQVTADFADMYAREVAWEPQAERFAAIVSSPLAIDHVQTIRYGGEERRVVIAPAASSSGSVEPLLFAGVSAVVVSPRSVRYGHHYPLIVYKSHAPLAWHPLSALHEEGVGIIIVPEQATLTSEFWTEVSKLAWVDASRTVVAFARQYDVIRKGAARVARGQRASDPEAAESVASQVRRRIAASAAK